MEQVSKVVNINNPGDKYYFSHFANMALHNALMILNHIALKLGYEPTFSERNIDTHPLLNSNPEVDIEKYAHCIAMLTKRLPVTAYLHDDNNPRAVLKNLKSVLYDLVLHRNYCAHYYYEPQVITSKHFHFQIGTNTPNFSALSYTILLQKAAKEAQKRNRQLLSDENFAHIYTTSGTKGQSNYKRKFFDLSDEQNATKRSVFLLCFFLERRSANQLISRIFGLRDTRTKETQATRETFMQFCCTVPHPKLESGELWLDMLNELQKVPSKLYAVLPEDIQKLFDPNRNEQITEDTTPQSIMRRYSDRFPELCLRFFDDTDYIPGLRFQIYLGKVCTKKYSKPVGKDMLERRIVKDLSVFGKLDDYQQKRNIPKNWLVDMSAIVSTEAQSDDVQSPIIETMKDVGGDVIFYAPRFQITNNGIGCKLTNTHWPNWKVLNKDGNRNLHFNYRFQPDIILPTYELPNLFLYAYLHKQPGINLHSPTDFLKEYAISIRKCISDVQSGILQPNADSAELKKQLAERYHVKLSDLPEVVRAYVSNKLPENITTTLHKKIKSHLKTTKELYNTMSDPDMKFERGKRKNGWTKGKAGTYISHDAIRFMRHEAKPNDFYHNYIQKSFALWGANITPLNDLLAQLRIVGKDNHLFFHNTIIEYRNAFQQKVAKHKGKAAHKITYPLKRFFSDYLKTKITYLETLMAQLTKTSLPQDEMALLIKIFKIKIKTKESWNYDDLHVYLPRGIFTEVIGEAIQNYKGSDSKLNKLAKEYNDRYTSPHTTRHFNPAYVITKIFPESQPFYNKTRCYNLHSINKDFPEEYIGHPADWENELRGKIDTGNYKQLYNKIDITEKNIRYTQRTDKLLWEMIKIYIQMTVQSNRNKQLLDNVKWTLNNIGYDINNLERNILNEKADMSNSLHGKTITAVLSIKDYGKFRRIQHDNRLKSLFTWFAEDSISFEKVEQELQSYDQLRHQVLEQTFKLEQIIVTHMPDTEREKKKKTYSKKKDLTHASIPFRMCIEYLFQKLRDTEVEVRGKKIPKQRFVDFRNRLEHNAYPTNDQFPASVQKSFLQQCSNTALLTVVICDYIQDAFKVLITKAQSFAG